jgi:hypothetical protein
MKIFAANEALHLDVNTKRSKEAAFSYTFLKQRKATRSLQLGQLKKRLFTAKKAKNHAQKRSLDTTKTRSTSKSP